MKTQLKLASALLLLSAINYPLSAVLAQGSLTPPGAPAPTMKSLAQIEPRTPISAAPFTITQSGSYYLTGNLTVAVGNAISIVTNGVTLDLNGFTIASTEASPTGAGILLLGVRDVAIFNGHITGGVTNNSSGVYGGPGFLYGIYIGNNSPVNTRISGVSVSGCLWHGIYIGYGDSTIVESCTVRTAGSYVIVANTIRDSVAAGCGLNAMVCLQVTDSWGDSVGTGSNVGIQALGTALNCYGSSSSGGGIYAYTAQNCVGRSNTSTGTGITANTAQNCYGYGSGGGYGIYATYTAQNCVGFSSPGFGTGLYAGDIAIGCRGTSDAGIGLNAFIANSCHGTTTSGTALSTTHNVNSF